MYNWHAGEHIHCLDMLRVASPPGSTKPFSDCAILLEIWDFGGLLQTNLAIPEDIVISIPSVAGGIAAKVQSCEQDAYGYLVEIQVQDPGWFPQGYMPSHVILPQPESLD
jgi:hypothetical protein